MKKKAQQKVRPKSSYGGKPNGMWGQKPTKKTEKQERPKKKRKEIKTKTYAWAKKEIKGKVIYSKNSKRERNKEIKSGYTDLQQNTIL